MGGIGVYAAPGGLRLTCDICRV